MRPNPADLPDVDTIGYVRVSTEQQATEDRVSLGEQRQAIAEKATRMGRWIDPRAVFEDAGVSGATAERRPGFMAMLAYCEARPRPNSSPALVLVLNDSRFGRFEDSEEATHWRFVLKRLGWIVRFCEGDDLEDGIARKVMRLIGSEQAGEYRKTLKRTTRRYAAATAREGRWQSRAPMGYRRLATRRDGAQRILEAGQRKADDEVVRLALGPEHEQHIVRFAFETYAAGETTLGRLTVLLQDRFPDVRLWSRAHLNELLKNPAYMGDVVWCRRPHDADERAGRRIRDRSEWVISVDAHPAIVSRSLFALVADRLRANKRETRATQGGYPLSGLVRCAHCGDFFIGAGGRRGPADDPDRYRFYRDKGSISAPALRLDGACAAQRGKGYIATLRKQWLEATVVEEIARVVSDPRVQAAIAKAVDTQLAAAQGHTVDRQASLGADLQRLTDERTRIVGAIGRGNLQEQEAATLLTELRARIAAVEAELTRVRFERRRTSNAESVRDQVLAAAQHFAEQAMKASGPALRQLVRHWLADAVMNKETRTLTLYIRKVPDVAGIDLNGSLQRDGQKHSSPFIVRRLKVPGARRFEVEARERRAGGAR